MNADIVAWALVGLIGLLLIALAVLDEIHVTGDDYQVEAFGSNPVTWTYGPPSGESTSRSDR